MKKQTSNFIDSKETIPLRASIGDLIGDLEKMSGSIFRGEKQGIKPGLDIRQLLEYTNVICALSNLREAAARKYHTQNDLPL